MNPQLLITAAKAAYENREVAAKLLTKIKDWQEAKTAGGDPAEKDVGLEERVEKLERLGERNVRLCEKQSELIAGLAEHVAEMSVTTQNMEKKVKRASGLAIVAAIVSAVALCLWLLAP